MKQSNSVWELDRTECGVAVVYNSSSSSSRSGGGSGSGSGSGSGGGGEREKQMWEVLDWLVSEEV